MSLKEQPAEHACGSQNDVHFLYSYCNSCGKRLDRLVKARDFMERMPWVITTVQSKEGSKANEEGGQELRYATVSWVYLKQMRQLKHSVY